MVHRVILAKSDAKTCTPSPNGFPLNFNGRPSENHKRFREDQVPRPTFSFTPGKTVCSAANLNPVHPSLAPWKRLFAHNSLKTHENVTQRKEPVGVYGRVIKTSVQVLPARITKVNHFWPYYPRTFHPEKGRRFYGWFALIQLPDPLTDVAPLWENREIDASLLYSSRYLYF